MGITWQYNGDEDQPQAAPSDQTSLGDYPLALGGAAAKTAATYGAGARAASDATDSPNAAAIWKTVQDGFDTLSDAAYNAMTPEAKSRLHSQVTSQKFWEHQISSAILKGLDMTPSLAAVVAPTLLAPAAAPAIVAGGAAAQGASQTAEDTYNATDAMSDEELRKAYPLYDKLRAQGVDEDDARAQANQKLMGFKPLVNAAVNAGAMLLGPAGRMAGVIPEEAGAGLLKRTMVGAGEGALGGAAMGATGETQNEQLQIDLDQRTQLDPALILAATADSAATMGALGAVGGAFTGHTPDAAHDLRDSAKGEAVQTVEASGPDAAQTAALEANQKVNPPPSAPTDSTGVAESNNVPTSARPQKGDDNVLASSPGSGSDVRPARAGGNSGPDKGVLTPPDAAPAAPTLSDDTGKTVPESQPTLQAQQDQLVNGQRRAMLFPKGTDALPLPDGMKATKTKDGAWHYNPDAIKPKEIYEASKAKALNTVLDLGDFSKKDLEPKVAAGETPVAVTERQPDGVEVKAAAGTDSTAPSQVDSLEATKTPGNTVQVESGQSVLSDRAQAAVDAAGKLRQKKEPTAKADNTQPRVKPPAREVVKVEAFKPDPALHELDASTMAKVGAKLDSLRRIAEQQEAAGTPVQGGVDAFMERKKQELIDQARAEQTAAQQPKEPAAPRARAEEKNVGKKRGKAEVEARTSNNARADDVVARFKPSDEERSNNANSVGRELLLDRVRGMVETAEKEGVKIPKGIKDNTQKEMDHNNSVALLAEAKALLKSDASTPHLARFISREFILRHEGEEGRRSVLADRRAEGDQKFAPRRSLDLEKAPAEVREKIEAEERKLESVADEAPSPEERVEEPDEDAPPEVEAHERAPVTLKGNEVTAVKDRAGTFKVETKRVIRRRLGEEGPDAGRSTKQQLEAEKALDEMEPLHSMSYGAALHQTAKHGYRSGLEATVSRHVIPQLQRLVGDMQVHFLDDADMDHLDSLDSDGDENFGRTQAFFHRDKRVVYARASALAGDPLRLRHILTHEGIHAATLDAMSRSGEKFRSAFEQMMTDARAHIGDTIADRTYGFTDPYEFMAEAMSNPRFMDMLGEAPASDKLVQQLGMNKLSSLKDAVIRIIRKLLNIPANKYSALEAALRFHNDLIDEAQGRRSELNWEPSGMAAKRIRAGAFDDPRQQNEVNKLFQRPFTDAVARTKADGEAYVRSLTQPGKIVANAIEKAKGTGGAMRKALLAVTTNDQYRQQVEHLLPMVRELFDNQERVGVVANKLKEDGLDLTGALIRAQKANPGLFEQFSKLINDQTMVGADASAALGEGRNGHLAISKALQDKIDKGTALSDVEHDTAMNSWEARNAHPELARRYADIIKQDPEFAPLQKKLFGYYEQTQLAMAKGQLDSILRSYDFKGSDAERAAAVEKLAHGRMTDEDREAIAAQLGVKDPDKALDRIEAVDSLKVKKGPYAPLMRRGEHAVVGEYKVAGPTKGTQLADGSYEFKSRQDAHDFAVKTGLHTETKSVWYDSATGKPVKAKADAVSTAGGPEQRFQVRVQTKHLEFHESRSDAAARIEELKKSGLFDKLGLEERRHIESENSEFSGRGVESLLRSLAAQKHYQEATEHERGVMRHTIREAGLRAMSDNRVQARRLPRRYVEGASDDAARNLYDYNNSQANYRARLQYNQAIDDGLKAMWDHVQSNRYTPDNEARSIAANEVERRMRAPDPNDYSGAYTEWTRRLSTWSYIDRMMRPSHLILHQTHLPMITAPYMSGRHGIMSAYGATMRAFKELTGFYGSGVRDSMDAFVGSALQKGTDYVAAGKKAFAASPDGVRLGKMLDTLGEIGVIHPSAGIEAGKYMPSRQLAGPIGVLDRGLNKVDTVFRHLTNATEAINRIAGAAAAYRLEFNRLTREGKGELDAHNGATEYARQTLTDTQGLYSSTNAAPIFKNKFLKPFLQFKQFPQMMYHLLSKLAVQSFKGETRQAKIQAMASLAAILGMHSMMAGVLQGLPLEPFKLLGLVSKGIGLTDGDWSDVENAERRSIKAALGNDAGDWVLNGLGNEMLGVDVHHRLGLNSFVTYGMPDQLDSKSVSEFILNAVVGAPGGLVTDAVKGTHKMLNGDIEGGALQAAPLQALRDIRNAVSPPDNKYGYEASPADHVKSLLGFTPAAKANASEGKEAVYQATHEYDAQRTAFSQEWVQAADKDAVWQKISNWNASLPASSRLTKGDLFKALHAAHRNPVSYNASIGGVRTNPHNKGVAQATMDLYQ